MVAGFDIIYTGVSGILVTILLIYIYYRVQVQDTQPQTIWFTIDTARTLRYLLFLSILSAFYGLALVLFLPAILAGLITFVVILFVLLIDLLLLIGSIIVLIFDGSPFDLINIGEVINLGIIHLLFEFQSTFFETDLIIIVSATFGGIISGVVVGRYIEDRKSATLIWFIQLIISMLGISLFLAVSNVSILDLQQITNFTGNTLTLVISLFLYLIVLLLSSRLYYNRTHDDDLIDLIIFGHRTRIILAVLYLPIIALVIIGSLTMISFEIFSIPAELGLAEVSVILLTIFSGIIIIGLILHNGYWAFLGDLPMDIKLGELEYREEILAYAREFRDLNEENIEDFARKSS